MHSFLTSALGGCDWLTSGPGRFTPGKKPGTKCTGSRLDFRADPDVLENRHIPCLCRGSNPGISKPVALSPRYRTRCIWKQCSNGRTLGNIVRGTEKTCEEHEAGHQVCYEIRIKDPLNIKLDCQTMRQLDPFNLTLYYTCCQV